MQKIKKILPFVLIIIFFVLATVFLIKNEYKPTWKQGLQVTGQNLPAENIKYVKIGGQVIKVDLALTPTEQEKGLSGRKSLAEDAGMLFIFPKPSRNYFWMPDMNFPIDIIWLAPHSLGEVGLDENLQVIYIKKDASPGSYPETFGPNENSKYVLEVSAGFSEKNNVKEGNLVEFLP